MKSVFPCACAVLRLAIAFSVGIACSAHAAPPSPGTILQQTIPPSVLPSAPGPVLTLPAPARQKGQAAVKIPVRKIALEGNSLIRSSDLMPLVQDLQGKTVTLGELNGAAYAITRYYRSHGYPLAYAYIPAQTISHGVVHIAVVEPRYDKISIQGHSRLKAGQAERTLGLQSGTPIERGPLERGLLLLNNTPGVRVAGTLVPGARPRTSSLGVKLSDTPRLRAAAIVDNDGNDYTGRIRGQAELAIDNPFGYGAQIAVNGLTTEGGLLHSGGFTLLSPNLYHGLRASFYGSHTEYRLGGVFAKLNQHGRADQWGMSLAYPAILQPGRMLNARVDLLRDRFRQQSTTVGFDDRSHIDLVRLTLNGAVADRRGGMTSGEISLSRGELTLDSADAQAADAAGPNAAGTFWVTQFEVQRNQLLSRAFRLQLNLSGQLASRNLDGSQKFYLGGPTGVMSYPVSEAGGDAGLLLRLKLAHIVPLGIPGVLEAALLGQYGEIWLNHTPYAGATEPNRTHLAGAGIGLDYHWSKLTAQLDYIHRLGSAPFFARANHKEQLWASVQLVF